LDDAPADQNKGERVLDYHKICQNLRFDRFTVRHKYSGRLVCYGGGGEGTGVTICHTQKNYSAVSDIDRVIWMGDLNFRAVDNRTIDRLLLQATTAPTNIILANDQLQHEMKLG
jgi:hypothetical protein